MQKPKLIPSLLFLLLFLFAIPHLSLVQAAPCESTIPGDANGDGRVDIADPIAILGYLFGRAGEPVCLGLANVNADQRVDIADAIYLLNYLFANGPAPKPLHRKILKINLDGLYTNSRLVILFIFSGDLHHPVPLTQMQFSNDNRNWSAWEPTVFSKEWTLTPGDGEKTVYLRLKDASGNLTSVYSDTIILDTQGPSLEITSPKEGDVIR